MSDRETDHTANAFAIGVSATCDHESVSYLGQMGAARLYHCAGCDGVVTRY